MTFECGLITWHTLQSFLTDMVQHQQCRQENNMNDMPCCFSGELFLGCWDIRLFMRGTRFLEGSLRDIVPRKLEFYKLTFRFMDMECLYEYVRGWTQHWRIYRYWFTSMSANVSSNADMYNTGIRDERQKMLYEWNLRYRNHTPLFA